MQLLTVRGALPAHRHAQADITDALAGVIAQGGGLDERLLRRFHGNSGVEFRHTVLPLEGTILCGFVLGIARHIFHMMKTISTKHSGTSSGKTQPSIHTRNPCRKSITTSRVPSVARCAKSPS